jgi:hypothetical protein
VSVRRRIFVGVSADGLLFATRDLRTVLESHERQMYDQLAGIQPDEFLAMPAETLAESFIDQYRIEVPVLQYDQITVEQAEAQVDVRRDRGREIYDRSHPFYLVGTEVAVYVPFEGDGNLFACTPSTRNYNPPSGEVRQSELVLRFTRLDHDADAVKAVIDHNLGSVQQYLGWIAADARTFNDELPGKVGATIEQRREKLLADRGLVGALGYELRVREDAPKTYAVPMRLREVPIARPRSKRGEPFKPQPTLLMEPYEHILGILQNMVEVIERSPTAFARMKEEHLRQHFLVQLNGQYEGQATGETFNFEGKTDILIRAGGKNIFIAECKYWRGPKTLKDAVDQLLGYASWRDTKTAILLFNRTKKLSDVLSKIPDVMRAHSSFIREAEVPEETAFRYVLAHKDDPSREIIVTVLVFDVPA